MGIIIQCEKLLVQIAFCPVLPKPSGHMGRVFVRGIPPMVNNLFSFVISRNLDGIKRNVKMT